MAVGQHARAEQAIPVWGYLLTHHMTGSTLVRCVKDAPHPGAGCPWDRRAIPFDVHYAECSCGCVVRSGRVSYKAPLRVSEAGCVEFTAPEGQ
jgi:hypothetical protein